MTMTDREYQLYKIILDFKYGIAKGYYGDYEKYTLLDWGMLDACNYIKDNLLRLTDCEHFKEEEP